MHGLNLLFLHNYLIKIDRVIYIFILLYYNIITYLDLPTAESPMRIIFKSAFCLKNSSSFNSVDDIFFPLLASFWVSDISLFLFKN